MQIMTTHPDVAQCVRFEVAKSADDSAIAALEGRFFPDVALGLGEVAYYRRRDQALVLIARDDDDNSLLGYVVASLDSRGGGAALWIVTLAVQPRARRCGLGRTLLRRATAFGRKLGANVIKVQVNVRNQPARRLYESCGLTTTRRLPNYYAPGRHAYLMERPLRAPSQRGEL